MKIKEETKVIEQKVLTFIAEDGIEFETEKECKDYEAKLAMKDLIDEAEKLRINELDDNIPLSNDGLVEENNVFRWYKLESEADFEILNKAYAHDLRKPEHFPEIMCVETVGYEAYMDDAYSYDMTTCKSITESFWKKLGYKVVFEEMK